MFLPTLPSRDLITFSLLGTLYSIILPLSMPRFTKMCLTSLCKRSFSVPVLFMVLLLFSSHTATAVHPSSSLFPLEIFGTRDMEPAMPDNQRRQKTFRFDRDPPRYSNSSFPGDETGSSPFFYCPESDPKNDIFDISKIVFNPNPPRISYVFVFHAHGYFRETISERHAPFRVRCTVRNEDRDGLDFTFENDFCDFVDLMELDGRSTGCPPGKGGGTIHKIEFVDWGISEVRVKHNTYAELYLIRLYRPTTPSRSMSQAMTNVSFAYSHGLSYTMVSSVLSRAKLLTRIEVHD